MGRFYSLAAGRRWYAAPVRFSVQLPTDRVQLPAEFLSATAVGEMARAAEAAGFGSLYVTDHPIPGEAWLRSGGHHTLDPFVTLSFAAAATARIRLQTHVLVLPYRNPFLVAKSAATLDVLSGGRLTLGVSAGYLESEFAALGVPFGERNERTDEALGALRAAWSGERVALEGRGFRAEGNLALPLPAQRPGPPIWVGGNSRRAIRRAVELADGWLPFPAPKRLASHVRTAPLTNLEELRAGLAYAREHADRVGRRTPLDVCFVPFGFELGVGDAAAAERLGDVLPAYRDAGVTWLAVGVKADSRAEWCRAVASLGARLAAEGWLGGS
jgi:probable F420-dependent oxidoreductase